MRHAMQEKTQANVAQGVGRAKRSLQEAALQNFVEGRGGSLFLGVVDALGATLDTLLESLGVALLSVVPCMKKSLRDALEPILHA